MRDWRASLSLSLKNASRRRRCVSEEEESEVYIALIKAYLYTKSF